MKGPTWVDQLLRKKQAEPPKREPEPEAAPSYFDRPEADDREETKPRPKSGIAQGVPAARQAERAGGAKPPPVQPGDAKASFDDATDAQAVKARQEFDRRFITEATREAALEAREDAASLREAVQAEYERKHDAAWQVIQRLVNDPRPAPQDASRDANQAWAATRDWRQEKMAAIDRQLEITLGEIALTQAALSPKWGPFKDRIGTTYVTDPSADFTAAAASPWPVAADESPAPEAVVYDMAEDDELAARPRDEPWPGVDWVAEFNKVAKPAADGMGMRP